MKKTWLLCSKVYSLYPLWLTTSIDPDPKILCSFLFPTVLHIETTSQKPKSEGVNWQWDRDFVYMVTVRYFNGVPVLTTCKADLCYSSAVPNSKWWSGVYWRIVDSVSEWLDFMDPWTWGSRTTTRTLFTLQRTGQGRRRKGPWKYRIDKENTTRVSKRGGWWKKKKNVKFCVVKSK